MKAVVLCGGKGTRLRPYTEEIPKPMLPLGNKPILQYILENAKRNGIEEVFLTIGYKKDQIKEYFGDGREFGIKIRYVEEDEPKNTAGSILPLKDELKETFLVLMGDHLTNINLRKMIEFHKAHGSTATIAVKEEHRRMEYGIVDVEDGKVLGFKEKPIYTHYINTAIYAFEPTIFGYIQEKEDFGKDVFPRMLEKGEKICAYVFNEYWIDIGRVADYERLNEFINIFSLIRDMFK